MLGRGLLQQSAGPASRLQYLAMPMYSFNRNELNGIGQHPAQQFAGLALRGSFTTSFTIQRFERYTKLEPAFTFAIPHRVGAPVQQQVQLANTIGERAGP